MTIVTDYSALFNSEDDYTGTWKEIYDFGLTLPDNLSDILRKTIFLPYDFYDLITAYFLLPSALCRIVPYLFLCGQSGSGKSTLAKIASYLHDIPINSSSDTFAGIRNALEQRRRGLAEVPSELNDGGYTYKAVERNICMVWDDISPTTFTNQPELYNMFKFGYDKTTDKIILSSKEVGENLEFHCFCPKVFSSISPLHLDDRFKELKRRLIVIPCKRVEELSAERQAELGIDNNTWQSELIDVTDYKWKGFREQYDEYWDLPTAARFVQTKKELSKSAKGLTSQQRAVSLDLMATGITCGIWSDRDEAFSAVKTYWSWFKQETEKSAGLTNYLRTYIKQEETNARNGQRELAISTVQLRTHVDNLVTMGWLYERPRPSGIKAAMYDLGLKLHNGIWSKD